MADPMADWLAWTILGWEVFASVWFVVDPPVKTSFASPMYAVLRLLLGLVVLGAALASLV